MMDYYQEQIISECRKKGSGGLSLPMGSGKTRIALILAQEYAKKGPCLIVVSKMLITTWVGEIHKHFPGMEYAVLHKDYYKSKIFKELDTLPGRITITTPEVLRMAYNDHDIESRFTTMIGRETNYRGLVVNILRYNRPDAPFIVENRNKGFLYATEFNCLVVDEVQEYTNAESRRCRAIASICAGHRWGLSGTMFPEPTPERILGYYLIINDKTIPSCLPDVKRHIRSPQYPGYGVTMVSRQKNEAFTPPEVREIIVSHGLTPGETQMYLLIKKVTKEINKRLKEAKEDNNITDVQMYNTYLLLMVVKFRIFMVSPLLPYAQMAIKMTDLSQSTLISRIFAEECAKCNILDYLNDVESVRSSRVREVQKVVEQHADDKLVLFTCFRLNLNIIKYYLTKRRKVFVIEATLDAPRRAKVLAEFEATSNGILLLTYDLGAEGLNLQFCSTVLIVDVWWNVGKIQQAIARLLRFGQTASVVNVYIFMSVTGIENALFIKHRDKEKVQKELLSGMALSHVRKLKPAEILRILELEDNAALVSIGDSNAYVKTTKK